ncbi:MAG: MazG family protein [Clostridium sp.]|nr:MazG family protein [Clostridium sp.]
MSQATYSYEDFLQIVETLRGENGCPWDLEKTHLTLRPGLMEEACEVLAAIRTYSQTGKDDNLIEELGDVLLQVVMHAQIAKEEGRFTMDDVIHGIAQKMVRRHPHVFGDAQVQNTDEVLTNWEEIKRGEHADQSSVLPLHEIPVELPTLTRALKVLKKAGRYYEPMADYTNTLKQLDAAVQTLTVTAPTSYDETIQAQIAQILLSCVNLSRICKISIDQLLRDQIDNIIDKWEP